MKDKQKSKQFILHTTMTFVVVLTTFLVCPEINAALVTFNTNAGTETVTDMPASGEIGTSIPNNIPQRMGYTFIKWHTRSDGKCSKDGGTTNVGQYYSPGGTYSGGTVTLYAQWAKKILDGVYVMRSRGNSGNTTQTNVKFDVLNTNLANANPPDNNQQNQQWFFKSQSDGSYAIFPLTNLNAAITEQPTPTATLRVETIGGSVSDIHKWYLIEADGFYKIVSKGNPERVLCVGGALQVYPMNVVGEANDENLNSRQRFDLVYINGITACKAGATLPETIPTREGYTFFGWHTRQDGKCSKDGGTTNVGRYYFPGQSNDTGAQVILYAQWGKIIPNGVYVMRSQGNSGNTTQTNVKFDELNTNLTNANPANNSQQNQHWYFQLQNDGAYTIYPSSNLNAAITEQPTPTATLRVETVGGSLSNIHKWYLVEANGFYKIVSKGNPERVLCISAAYQPYPMNVVGEANDENLNSRQRFDLISVNNTFGYEANANGQTVGNMPKQIVYNGTIASNVPTREGYTFIGWNINPKGDGGSSYNGATKIYYAPGGTYTGGTTALYAIWAKIIPDGRYYIQDRIGRNTSMISENPGSSVQMSSAPMEDGMSTLSQQFYFQKQSNGSYSIRNKQKFPDGDTNDLVIDRNSDENPNASVAVAGQKVNASSTRQRWYLVETESGETTYYKFVAAGGVSGGYSRTLNIQGGIPSGVNIVTFPDRGQNNTEFSLKLVEYSTKFKLRYGDVNDDGEIDVFDMVAMRNHIFGKGIIPNETKAYKAADCNEQSSDIYGDGTINVSDMAAVRSHIFGEKLLPSFEWETTEVSPVAYAAYPTVFLVEDEYQIFVPVTTESFMWVTIGDKTFYDHSNGVMRSGTFLHKVSVPQNVLNEAGKYTVHLRKINQRKAYNTETGDVSSIEIGFKVPSSKNTLNIYQVNDTHDVIDAPVASARTISSEIDLLVLNGDILNDITDIEKLKIPYIISGQISKGAIPTIYTRGNHEIRGAYSENWEDYGPTAKGKSYYTFRYGDLWGIVLDSGEDKADSNAEYGYTIAFEDSRREQVEFMDKVVAQDDYKNAKFRLVISHVPITSNSIDKLPANEIEKQKYWAQKLRQVNPTLYLTGHYHSDALAQPGNGTYDKYGGMPCPMIMAKGFTNSNTSLSGAFVTIDSEKINLKYINEKSIVVGVNSCSRTDLGNFTPPTVAPFTLQDTPPSFSSIAGMNTSIFAAYPSVFAVEDEYQIIIPVNRETTMWVKVGNKIFYDHFNGNLRSGRSIHKVSVPQNLLDETGSYTVYCREIIERKAYYTTTGSVYSLTVSNFESPVKESINIINLHDAKNQVDPSVAAGGYFNANLDLLVLSGDILSDVTNIEQFKNIYKISGGITQGKVPCVFARGNTDMRGIYAEQLEYYAPTNIGKSYYTFKTGKVWGVVMDGGEDKVDSSVEYGYTSVSEPFRKEQVEFLNELIEKSKYQNAEYKLVVSHFPFTRDLGLDNQVYSLWTSKLNLINPTLMLSGNFGTNVLATPGDGGIYNFFTLPCPMVISGWARDGLCGAITITSSTINLKYVNQTGTVTGQDECSRTDK